jgi:hypothetical protein
VRSRPITCIERSGAALAALLALATPSLAAASDADIAREAQDRLLINDLMWNYVRAIDTLNEDAYPATFTPDGVFTAGAKPVRGQAALRQMVTDLKKGRADREAKGAPKQPPTHHIITNVHIAFADKDHARMDSYWMTVFPGAPNTQPPRLAAAGRGIDQLVRVNGKWLIQSSDVAPQD